MRYLLALLLLSSSCALAQDEPSEAYKTWALKRAYELNGNSMVRLPKPDEPWTSLDLSQTAPFSKPVKTIPILPGGVPLPPPRPR